MLQSLHPDLYSSVTLRPKLPFTGQAYKHLTGRTLFSLHKIFIISRGQRFPLFVRSQSVLRLLAPWLVQGKGVVATCRNKLRFIFAPDSSKTCYIKRNLLCKNLKMFHHHPCFFSSKLLVGKTVGGDHLGWVGKHCQGKASWLFFSFFGGEYPFWLCFMLSVCFIQSELLDAMCIKAYIATLWLDNTANFVCFGYTFSVFTPQILKLASNSLGDYIKTSILH